MVLKKHFWSQGILLHINPLSLGLLFYKKCLTNMLDKKLQSIHAEFPIPNYVPGTTGNQNRKTTLELGLKEKEMLEKRLKDKGRTDLIRN